MTAEGVHAQARLLAEGKSKVAAAVGVEATELGWRHDAEHQGLSIIDGEGGAVDGDNRAVDAQARRPAHVDMQV